MIFPKKNFFEDIISVEAAKVTMVDERKKRVFLTKKVLQVKL
jgi:hypothetical protein